MRSVMGLVARQVASIAMQKRLPGEGPLHGVLVCRLGGHALRQEFTKQPGDAGIAPGGLDAGPLGDVLFEGDGYVAEAIG